MSAQTLPIRGRQTYLSWRLAIVALAIAIALAVALVVANGLSAGQQTSGRGSVKTTGQPVQTTYQIPGGPAQGHPLP